MRIPISFKISGLAVTIVIVATAAIVIQASDSFRKNMYEREDFSNMREAAARAKEIENLFGNELEKGQILGSMLLDPNSSAQFEINFKKDKNLVSVEVWKVVGTEFELLNRRSKDEYFESQKLGIEEVRKKIPFPLQSLAQKNIEIRNSTLTETAPLITMGFPLGRDENDRVTHVVLMDLQLAALQKPFSEVTERTYYMIDRNGDLLAHQEESQALARASMRASPLAQKALKDNDHRKQIKFMDPQTGEAFIGAYVKNPFWGTTVVSQISENIILDLVKEVQRKAYYISGIVISIALFFCFLFSMTLTGPIERLAALIKEVSKGNFNVKAMSYVKTKDEVGDLAAAFDNMTEGLKERDKVKNLFSKFHGSSIAEDLLKNDIGVGGTKKEVTVFFSDIRGFTKFSEGHTPEEVVAMLNEYFKVMVKIINEHGGVVDKFIGDAIMAVWGAPHSSEHDTENAVKACLEMRKSLVGLNQLRESRGQPPIMMGMGLHCGPAISGTIGSEERMEYTVIGDTVNMTSRIEASTKVFGSDLLISEAVFEKMQKSFLLEYVGSAEVKGKSDALKLFKVKGHLDANGQPVEIRTPYSDFESEGADKVKIAS